MSFSVDHVFARGLPPAVTLAGVARDVDKASDHRPVWVEIEWPSAHGWPYVSAGRPARGQM